MLLPVKEFVITLAFNDVLFAANIWLASSKMCGHLTSQWQISSEFDILVNGAGIIDEFLPVLSDCDGIDAADVILSVRDASQLAKESWLLFILANPLLIHIH